jgi:hypothetical protein
VYRDTLKENDMKHKHLMVGLLLLIAAMALAACGTASPTAEATPCPEPEPCPDCPEAPPPPEAPECPEPVVAVVPFEQEWANSPHNDAEAEAFRHWDEDDPAEIPESCAKCHSTPGYIAFMGADGSQFGVVEGTR